MSLAKARQALAQEQRRLAALLMERGGTGEGAGVGTAYFARRRRIDRIHYLEGSLPRTLAAIPRDLLEACLSARPYALDDPVAEATAVAAWLWRQGERAEPAASLARIEAAGGRMMRRARAQPRLLVLRREPRTLLRGPARARAGRFAVALVREEGDVEVHSLTPERERLLRRGLDGASERDLAWLRRRGLLGPDRHP